MGSDLYLVSVSTKTDTTVSLHVDVIHPDITTIPADESFALMLLRDAAEHSPLAREMSFEDTLDAGWMKKFARGFIRSVKVSEIHNRPPKAALRDSDHAYWQRAPWMNATLEIVVTHPVWLQHVIEKTGWETRAFALISEYDECKPLAPGDLDETATPDGDDGFIPLPRVLLGTHLQLDETLPELLQCPAYSESAYEAVERIEAAQMSEDKLRSLLGRAVLTQEGLHMLTQVTGPNSGQLVHYRLGSSGSGYSTFEWIARAQLKANGKRGTPLDPRRVIADTPIAAMPTTPAKKTLEITLRIPPGGRALPFASASDALWLVLKRAVPMDSSDELVACPLTEAFLADQAEHEVEGRHRMTEVVPWVTKKYIDGWTIDSATNESTTFDSPEDARAALERPWPTATLTIKVTDAKWVEHWTGDRSVVVDWQPLPTPTTPPAKRVEPAPIACDARIVLVDDKSVWIAERYGATWKTRTGRRDRDKRVEKSKTAASPEKAQAAMTKAAAAKLKAGMTRAPENAVELVWERLGLELDDRSGVPTVTKAQASAARYSHYDGIVFYRAKDQVHEIANHYVSTVDEIAATLATHVGSSISLGASRPSHQISTCVTVTLA